jgi:hypothetical protein
MAEEQKEWAAIAVKLNEALRGCRLSPVQLAKRAGIDYHAARRYLRHGVANRTTGALRLCDFFAIHSDKSQKLQTPSDRLRRVLHESWDGSEAHAKLLAKLIGSTRPFKITERD